MERTLEVYGPDGTLEGERTLPERTRKGERVDLVDGVLYGEAPDGSRRELGRLVDGELQPPAVEGVLPAGERLQGGRDRIVLEGEELVEPGAVRLTARRVGGKPAWYDVQGVRTAADGSISVRRFAWRKGGPTIELPTSERRYAPAFDLAVSPEGRLVYLHPGPRGVRVVWSEAP